MGEPKLRFKADDGSDFPKWEEKMFWDVFANLTNNTLSRECLNAESGQARNIHYGDVLVKYGAVVDVQRDGAPFVNPDVECKRWDCLKDGDVVIADTAEDETVGKAVEISNAGSDIVYSGLHTIACRPKEEFAPGYLGNYINSMSYHDQLRPYMQGIKVTSVSKTNIGLTHLLVPTLPEQRKIADFLSAVDAVIAAQQAEVDAWEQRKKGVMQKLFSQEVRFKADDGSDFPDWEEKTLGELCSPLTYGMNAAATKFDGEIVIFASPILMTKRMRFCLMISCLQVANSMINTSLKRGIFYWQGLAPVQASHICIIRKTASCFMPAF